MRVLIIEAQSNLSALWATHLRRHGYIVRVADSEDAAFDMVRETSFHVIIMDILLGDTPALAVADYASVVQPEAQLILVTSSSFFSDGSIFRMCSNARAFVPAATSPEDLTAMVDHYTRPRPPSEANRNGPAVTRTYQGTALRQPVPS